MKFRITPLLLASGLVASLATPLAHATDMVWGTNLAAGPWDWNIGANWTGGTAPVVDTDRADLRKDWTAAATINLSAPTITNGILFDDTGAASDVNLTIGNGGTASNTLTLAGTAPAINVVANTLSVSAVVAGSWIKTGAGTLTLSGANTYTGGTTISAGSITAASNGALGTGSAANSIASGATLTLNTGITLAQTGMITMVASANGTGNRSTINLTGTAAFSNNIQLDYSGLTGAGNAFAQISGSGAGVFNGSVTFAAGKANATGANNIFVLRGTGSVAKATGTIDLLTGNGTGVGILRVVDGGAAWELSGTGNRWTTLDFNSSTAAQRIFVGAENTLSADGVLTNTNTTAGSLGTLHLRNIADTAGFNQTVAGIQDGTVGKVAVTSTKAATLTLNTTANQSSSGVISGAIALVKSGAAVQTLAGTNTYTGGTTVSAGTLLVNGALGATAVSVGADGAIGGSGTLGGSLSFATGADLNVVNLSDALAITGNVTFGGFGFSNITGWDYANADAGTYTLLSGSNIDLTNVSNVGAGAALDFGNGKQGYFQNGSLQVVIIPEPSTAALLGGMGLFALLRRRRA